MTRTVATIAFLCLLVQENCPVVDFSFPLGDPADSSIDSHLLARIIHKI